MTKLVVRIADILYRADGEWDEVSDPYLKQAEFLIRELGMTIERDGPPIVPPCHRYVTEWTTDD